MAPTSESAGRCLFVLLLLLGLQIVRAATTTSSQQQSKLKHPLVVLMLDGFRWNYLDQIPDRLGGFEQFVTRGVRAEWVNGVFPTLSYPSWTTLGTGLYPESHGILGNYFYSQEWEAQFLLEALNTETHWWDKAEPIWTTATKSGLRVATVLWSRSDVPVDGVLPEKADGYVVAKGTKAIERTLERVTCYLNDGFDFVMAYGEHIDNMGHSRGPSSVEVRQGLIDVGKKLQQFFDDLQRKGLKDKVNVLIVSDHGMTAHKKFEYIWDGIPQDDILYTMDQGAIVAVYLKQGHSPDITYEALKAKAQDLTVYLREDIPANFNYSKSPDAPDILLVANPGVTIKGSSEETQVPDAWRDNTMRGLHGYHPSMADMRTVFMGVGPDMKSGGVMAPAIDLVDIYQVYCELLGVHPQPHNGTWARARALLAGEPRLPAAARSSSNRLHPASLSMVVVAIAAAVLFGGGRD